jgi:biopolymer transport protein ExbB
MLLRVTRSVVVVAAMFLLAGAAAQCKAADEGGAPAGAAAAAGDQKPDETKQESGLEWVLRCSGLIGLLILGLSIYFVALIIRLFLEMRVDVAVPPDVVAHCEEKIRQRDLQGMYELVRESDSFFGRVMTSGIVELPNGLADAREAMERAGEAETVDMEKRISMLAVLGTLGPMIGLIGTLKGMISSFGVIARGAQVLRPAEVATGISEALLLTFEGVSLSIPAIFFFAFFRNRVATITANATLAADQLLRHFFRASRSKTPQGAGQVPAAAPAPAKARTVPLEG